MAITAFKLKDAVYETFSTAGTGAITPTGAVSGKGAQTFAAAFVAGDTMTVTAEKNGNRQTFLATWNGTTLARTATLFSTNGGSDVDFPVGQGTIFVGLPATYQEPLRFAEYEQAGKIDFGANRATNPLLQLDFSATSVATGLGIVGAAAGAALALAVISSGTNESYKFDAKGSGHAFHQSVATGNFVVGSASSLQAGPGANKLQLWGTDVSTGGIGIGVSSTTAATGPRINFYRSKNATVGSATVVASGDNLGNISWYGAQQTGTFATQTMAAQIRVEVDGTVTSGASGDMPGRIVFATTADGGAAVTDRLILDSAGVLKPNANDGVALGTGSLAFADLFLASGGVLNFNNGNYTITHSSGLLTFSAAAKFSGAVGVGIAGVFIDRANLVVVNSSQAASQSGAGFGHFKIATGTGDATDESLIFGVHDGDYAWIDANKPATSARALKLNPSGGAVSTGGTLGVTGDFAVNTNKFTVTASSGTVTTAGDITISKSSPSFLMNTSAASGQTAWVFYQANSTTKWLAGMQTDNSYLIWDNANATTALQIVPGAASAGYLTTYYTTVSSSASTGAIVSSGGLGVAKDGSFGGMLRVAWLTQGTADILNETDFSTGQQLKISRDSTSRVYNFNVDGGGGSSTSIRLGPSELYLPNMSTTGSAANVFADSGNGNRLLRSTSILAAKNIRESVTPDMARRMLAGVGPDGYRGFIYTSRCPADDPAREFVGFAAEWEAAIDPRFAQYGADGKPNGVAYERFVVPLTVGFNDHESRLDRIERHLNIAA